MKPVLVINFKAYKEAAGRNALKIAKEIEAVLAGKKVTTILAVQPTDLFLLKDISLPVFVQHLDPFEYGAHTGSIIPETVKSSGAKGTLLNHAEKKLPFLFIEKTVRICKEKRLSTLVCAENEEEAKKIALLKPDFIALEPKELIGGNVSVSEARPELISQVAKKVFPIPLLCGAGIHTHEDFKMALELGAQGVLVSSSIIKHKKPASKVLEILDMR